MFCGKYKLAGRKIDKGKKTKNRSIQPSQIAMLIQIQMYVYANCDVKCTVCRKIQREVGFSEGRVVGFSEGRVVGVSEVGSSEGRVVGTLEGIFVGLKVGFFDGSRDG